MLDLLPEPLKAWLGPDVTFWLGYFTNGKHIAFFVSVHYTVLAALLGAACALVFGLMGAALWTSRNPWLRWPGAVYVNMVRGVPDVLFFLFFPLAFEQAMEWMRASAVCTPEAAAERAGQWPPCPDANIFFSTYEYLALACVSLGIVYGAFAANVIAGAMRSVPRGQLEAARAFGLSARQVLWRVHLPQMWIYALPGLSNVWMLIIKATSLLSLLQIADIVQLANRLGAPNFSRSAGLVHGDWRWGYYLVLLVFYIGLTFVSERVFAALTRRASRGMAIEGAAR